MVHLRDKFLAVLAIIFLSTLIACDFRPQPKVPEREVPTQKTEEIEPPKVEVPVRVTKVRTAEERFQRSVANTLIHEGGQQYTNHPADPGGPTKWGITLHDVQRYINPLASASTVRALTKEQAVTIYRMAYWNVMRADELPAGVDYTVFDYAVNTGVGRAGRALRRAVGVDDKDWHITNEIVDKVRLIDPLVLIAKINHDRMAFQMGLPSSFNIFKRGWKNRILSVENISRAMAGAPRQATIGPDLHGIPRIGQGKAYEGNP